MKAVVGFFHRLAWAVCIGLATSVAAISPLEDHAKLARAVVLLDIPISAVERLWPYPYYGVWVFFHTPGTSAEASAMSTAIHQVVLCVAIYLPLFYLPSLVRAGFRRRRVAYA